MPARSTPLALSVSALAFALMGATPAIAQETEIDDVLIITAQKRPLPYQDIAGSFSVIGSELNGGDQLLGGEDIAQYVAGVQAALGNGAQPVFQIRGVGAVDYQALTPSAAAVYVDGVYLSTNVQTGPLTFDLERVEVLRGPQGVLYGRNASSGAVNFITRRPEGGDVSGYLRVGAGSHEQRNVAGALDMGLGEGLAARVSGRYFRQDAAIDNISNDPRFPEAPDEAAGERDEFGLRTQLQWTAPGTSRFLLRAHYAEDNGVSPAPRAAPTFQDPAATQSCPGSQGDFAGNTANPGCVATGFRGVFTKPPQGDHVIATGPDGVQDTDNEFYGLSLEGEGRWGDVSWFSLTAVEGFNQEYGFDFDGTLEPVANLSYDRDLTQISQELRVHGEAGWGRWMVGGFAAYETFDQYYLIWCGALDPNTLLGSCPYIGAPGRTGSNPASATPATTLISTIEQERATAALFSHNELRLSERLSAVLGGRLTTERVEGDGAGRHLFADGTIALNNRNDLGPAVGENTIDETQFTGLLGLNFKLDEASLAYAQFSQGYKSGGFNGEIPNNATHWADEGLFESETVQAFELGVKTARRGVRASFAAFYQIIADPQARVSVRFPLESGDFFTTTSLANLDEAISYGLEAEAAWSPQFLPGLDLNGSIAWLDTEIRQDFDPLDPSNFETFDGNALPFAPEVSAVIGVAYTRAVTESLEGAVRVDANYVSDFNLGPEGLPIREQDAAARVDARVALRALDRGLEAALWGRNLTDEEVRNGAFGGFGAEIGFLNQPLTWGVELTQRF